MIDESGLCRGVWLLLQSCPGKAADIEAETLAAFLAAVACGERGVFWAACWRHGWRGCC